VCSEYAGETRKHINDERYKDRGKRKNDNGNKDGWVN
jgi:hypothetical protein